MKKLFFTTILFFSISLSAKEWSELVTLGEINSGYKNGTIIFSASKLHNPANCSSPYYEVDPNDANVDYILSILLSAQARNAKIKIAVSTNKCGVFNYPTVTRVKLLP